MKLQDPEIHLVGGLRVPPPPMWQGGCITAKEHTLWETDQLEKFQFFLSTKAYTRCGKDEDVRMPAPKYKHTRLPVLCEHNCSRHR